MDQKTLPDPLRIRNERTVFVSEHAHDLRQNSDASRSPQGQEMRVLVVDDDDGARRALERGVRRLGYECRAARDGLTAWRMHSLEYADIILSDWNMPGLDGPELCQRVRTSKQSVYTYFIFMTGFADKDHFLRGMWAGADDYQTKPIDFDELHVRLHSGARLVDLYRRLSTQNAKLQESSRQSFRAARIDPLTRVSNLSALEEDLRMLWPRVQRYAQRYSLAVGIVERFTTYTESFGALAGDRVLQRIAETLFHRLRTGDGLYRYGDDKFVILLPEQSLTMAIFALERMRASVEKLAIPMNGGAGVVSISFGITEVDTAHDESPKDWLRRAESTPTERLPNV
jgi:two-component system, cell cycle response regulator